MKRASAYQITQLAPTEEDVRPCENSGSEDEQAEEEEVGNRMF